MIFDTLIADDQEISLIGLNSILNKDPRYSITNCSDGMEIIQLAKTKNFDLIIADYSLPHLNGLDALIQLIKSGDKSKKILISSLEEDRIKNISEKEGIDAYLLKSDSAQNILDIINKIMDGEKHFSSPRLVATNFLWNHPENPFLKLSNRELEVLKDLVHGKTLKSSAEDLNLKIKTIDVHRFNIKKKLKMDSKEIMKQAKIWGII